MRTALQHAWSTIEHGLNYKPDAVLPTEMKRDLFRLSALFELADKELNSIVAFANKIERCGGAIEFDDDELLDEFNLKKYVDVDDEIITLAFELERNGWEISSDDSPENLTKCIVAAHKIGVSTFSDLDWLLHQLDSNSIDILNDVANRNDDGIEIFEMLRILIIAHRPELFPEEKEIVDIIASNSLP